MSALAHSADSSWTSREVREVPVGDTTPYARRAAAGIDATGKPSFKLRQQPLRIGWRQLHDFPARSRNSRSFASSHRLGSVRLMFELPSCAYLAILRAPSLPNCDS